MDSRSAHMSRMKEKKPTTVAGAYLALLADRGVEYLFGNTETGLPGSRDGYIHWAQEMYDQAGMIREVVKWDYELRNPEQLIAVVDRALAIAATEPRGPVYLSLPREVIAAPPADVDASSSRFTAATA